MSSRLRALLLATTAAAAAFALVLSAAVAVAPDAHRGAVRTGEQVDLRPVARTAPARGTMFGTSIPTRPGETFREAFERRNRVYGRLEKVRMFFTGLPASWSTIRERVGRTSLSVSFKAAPAAVLSGRHDRFLRQWFAHAPRRHATSWTYWHEPEDDIAAGRFGARQYRRAWRHINRLANRAHNRRLRATLVMMCWTLQPGSRRNWRNYYAGRRVIDAFGFDCYNAGWVNGRYVPPREMFGAVVRLGRRTGKPWGIAEFGSKLAVGDDGRRRARWLVRSGRYLQRHKASFCTYFDSTVGGDFRLLDRRSRRAWRAVVTGRAFR